MSFEARYKKLNATQRQAVDTIDGPVMVVAGPGTGKTELLSMRAATILQRTDTLAENILCLTFTESGADAMRSRLVDIIGKDAYKIAVHTFHGLGTEIINQNHEYFYNGAAFKAADELSCYEILRGVFDELSYDNVLASKMNGEYTYLRDALTVISELKKSSLTSLELLGILDENDEAMNSVEPVLSELFEARISKTTARALVPIAHAAAETKASTNAVDITSLAQIIATSLAHAVDEADADNSTKPITAWRNHWLEKNEHGRFVFKNRKRQAKLRALSTIYDRYITRMQEAQLFDFDDMIMQVVHAIETHDELKYSIQEKYQYIMVDEFQDTNLAQARILKNLTDNEIHNGRPNILVVGDDDQAIYSFQGADVSNILNFRHAYSAAKQIVLTDNYRSNTAILEASRAVITQGSDRLENYVEELDKSLVAHHAEATTNSVLRVEADTKADEHSWLVKHIAQQIKDGTPASSITVLARRHSELIDVLPYFAKANIQVNYERRENVLENESVELLESIATIILSLVRNDLETANGLLPAFLAHPAWDFTAEELWKLSLSAHHEHRQWLDIMSTTPRFVPIYTWLIETAKRAPHTPLEQLLDEFIGKQTDGPDFRLPFYEYFFSEEKLDANPDTYLSHLEALQAIRATVREYRPDHTPTLMLFIESIELHRRTNTPIISVRRQLTTDEDAVNLMTVHRSKGLEFDTVYIMGAIDSMWGEKVRSKSRMIGYPENITLAPSGSTPDERLRLFFVAMTRAKNRLVISNARTNDTGKETLEASFLLPLELPTEHGGHGDTLEEHLESTTHSWYAPLVEPISRPMRQTIAPLLEAYKLSVTHLNAFIDVGSGGPHHFLINNLLRFPSAMSPFAAYGSAIHATLQKAHNHLKATGELKPLEDVQHDFDLALLDKHLAPDDYDSFQQRGSKSLDSFLSTNYTNFQPTQRSEASFSGQQVFVGSAHLTGALDLMDINTVTKEITVTDYKTGTPTRTWQGKTDYEKIKLHKYKQQLMFYKILVERSRQYAGYTVTKGIIQFVEPTQSGDIVALEYEFDKAEQTEFERLIQVIWKHITTLNLPDISTYSANYKGVVAFERDLLGLD